MPQDLPSGSEITSPALIGSLLSFVLFGMLVVQACLYTTLFPHDRRRVKALVYAVCFMMSLSLCLNASARFAALYTPLIGSLVGLLVQAFFAYRISMFRGARWVAGLVLLISLAQAAGGMASGLSVYISEQTSRDSAATFINFIGTPLVHLWLIGSAVSDMLIAISMTYLLLRTAEPSAEHIVHRVVLLIIETNALTEI
ncbi:hypothetical protein C8J57DRAFT_666785 [Mycena rebaudengoi]|nr:hypothetical protein C8J57DRAFT_102625 [Mycena rebaudengoi]KAJ7252210.1 hypothetical protein C8J57DRAFT_666785 [Mycena rebaudengoi]